jgi:hypothetical protein
MAKIVFWINFFDKPEWIFIESVVVFFFLNYILIGFCHMYLGWNALVHGDLLAYLCSITSYVSVSYGLFHLFVSKFMSLQWIYIYIYRTRCFITCSYFVMSIILFSHYVKAYCWVLYSVDFDFLCSLEKTIDWIFHISDLTYMIFFRLFSIDGKIVMCFVGNYIYLYRYYMYKL